MIFALSSLVLQQSQSGFTGQVIAASLFKNGYAVVIRQYDVPRPGAFRLIDPPRATLGSLWLTTSPGASIDRLITTQETVTSTSTTATLTQVVQNNVGKSVKVKLRGQPDLIEAKIQAASAGIVVLIVGEEARTLEISQIEEVRGSSSTLTWTSETKSQRPVIEGVLSGSGGKVFLMSLERGMTWAPAYRVDISDPKTLTFTARGTVMNELVELKEADVKLITGYPNLPFIGILDPANRDVTMDQFLNGLMSLGSEGAFRGRREMMTQNAGPRGGGWDADQLPDAANFQAEDLFFYRIPKASLKVGDRGLFTLTQFQAPYSHLYEWEVQDFGVDGRYSPPDEDQPGDVWHSLKFKNSGDIPLTTAPAMTVQRGEVLGQDTVKYTSKGAEVRLRITKALDVVATATEEERSRDTIELPWGAGKRTFDRVTLAGTLTITNRKSTSVDMRIEKSLTGEVLTVSNSGQATKLGAGVRALNSRNQIVWSVPVEAGKTLKLEYTYRLVLSN
ncbi:MAG TPA: hypothetical protein PLO61_06735 [Fimbriimonadaceae bacterium]|nr:hypothetical protein [Fimbriimonadaceae bacterium]HRJ33211.1 hypothetical protein [Fimbriimonadaceae bacterium]